MQFGTGRELGEDSHKFRPRELLAEMESGGGGAGRRRGQGGAPSVHSIVDAARSTGLLVCVAEMAASNAANTSNSAAGRCRVAALRLLQRLLSDSERNCETMVGILARRPLHLLLSIFPSPPFTYSIKCGPMLRQARASIPWMETSRSRSRNVFDFALENCEPQRRT